MLSSVTSAKNSSSSFVFYAKDIYGKDILVNQNEKTVLLMLNLPVCGGCKSFMFAYLSDLELENLVVLQEYVGTNLLKRQFYDDIDKSLICSKIILFEAKPSDSLNYIQFNKYKANDYPVLVFIDNKTQTFDAWSFDEIVSYNNLGFKLKKKFMLFIDEFKS